MFTFSCLLRPQDTCPCFRACRASAVKRGGRFAPCFKRLAKRPESSRKEHASRLSAPDFLLAPRHVGFQRLTDGRVHRRLLVFRKRLLPEPRGACGGIRRALRGRRCVVFLIGPSRYRVRATPSAAIRIPPPKAVSLVRTTIHARCCRKKPTHVAKRTTALRAYTQLPAQAVSPVSCPASTRGPSPAPGASRPCSPWPWPSPWCRFALLQPASSSFRPAPHAC